MTEAPIPANEPQRLAALHHMQLLDTPLEERFERITRLVCRLLGVPKASITLVDETRQWFKSVKGSIATETPRSQSFCAHTILSDEIMLVPDTRKDARFFNSPLVEGPENVGFYAGHPLRAQDGSRVGVLCAMDSKPRKFSEDDLQALRDLAALAESELNSTTFVDTQKELLSQLDAERRRALIDPLTRLWNREGIMEILNREHVKAKRHHERLGVLMADIDFFKKVNDDHGHLTGDAVLREVARRLLASFRDFDAVGRVGGEEFLIVMPNKTGNRLVETVAKRVCERVSESGIATNAGILPVTISIGGVDEFVDDSVSPDDLIKRADDALYRAKDRGRNRSEIVSIDRPSGVAA